MWSKKIFVAVVAVMVFSVGAAWADDDDRIYSGIESGFTGKVDIAQVGGVIPIREVSEIRDGYPVTLHGSLVSRSEADNTFLLEDSTGSIVVIIPEDRWSGYSPGSPVNVYGTVERNGTDGESVILASHVDLHEDK